MLVTFVAIVGFTVTGNLLGYLPVVHTYHKPWSFFLKVLFSQRQSLAVMKPFSSKTRESRKLE